MERIIRELKLDRAESTLRGVCFGAGGNNPAPFLFALSGVFFYNQFQLGAHKKSGYMDLSLSNISFNQILVFLSVVENEGFLKASSQLHLSQSAVSKSVAKLEKDLNLPLFHRTTRQLELTKEGAQLYEAWKPMMISMQTAYRHVLKSYEEGIMILRIGLVSTVIPEKYFSVLQKAIQDSMPEVQLQIVIDSMSRLKTMLREGELDVAFLPDFEHYFLDEQNIPWIWYQKKHARLIMSSAHPLAAKKAVFMEDILHEKFVTLQDQLESNYEKDLKERFADYDTEPNIVLPYSSAYALRNLFRPKDEVLFVDQFFDNVDYEDTVSLSVDDEWNGIICAWNETKNPSVQGLLDLVRTIAVIED